MNAWIFCVYVLTSTSGLILIKQAGEIRSLRFAVGFFVYGVGFLIWLWLLRRTPLSTAFPMAAGALIAATVIGGRLFLGEKIAAAHLGGIALILLGIVLVSWRSAPR